MHGRTLGLALAAGAALPGAASAAPVTCAQAATDIQTNGAVVTIANGQTCTQTFSSFGANATLEGESRAGVVLAAPSAGARAINAANVQNATVRNLTVQSVDYDRGGLRFTGDSTPTIENVAFKINGVTGASSGGGINIVSSSASGTITLRGLQLGVPPQVNKAGNRGGGAAIFVQNPGVSVVVDDVDAQGNQGGVGGGAIYVESTGSVEVTDSFFSTNTVVGFGNNGELGGALSILAPTVMVARNQFLEHHLLPTPLQTSTVGGALYAQIVAGGTSGTWRAGGGGAVLGNTA